MRFVGVVVFCACLVAHAEENKFAAAQKLADESAQFESTGQYAKAAELFDKAIDEFKKVAGADHPKVSEFRLKLAGLYLYSAQYDRSEPIMRDVLAQLEKQHGPNSSMLLASLSSLATLYTSMGSYDRAKPMYERALAIVKADEPNGMNAANLTAALGALHTFKTEYDAAIPLLKDALSRYEQLLGVDAADVASPCAALGAAYDGKGDSAKAEPLYQRALKLREAKQGAEHPQTALMRNNLAVFYMTQGAYDKAEPLSRKALADTETAFGPYHPQTGNLLNSLAYLLAARDKTKDVVPLLTRAAESTEHILRNARLTATESRMSQFLQLYAWQESIVYALAYAQKNDGDAARLAMSLALLRKGRTVDEAADLSRMVQGGLGGDDIAKFDKLRGLRAKLANLALGGAQTSATRDESRSLGEQAEKLEQELALRSLPLRTRALLPDAKLVAQKVAAQIPEDAVLLELVQHTPFDFKATKKQPRTLPARYTALSLDRSGKSRAIDLGPADVIDEAVARLLGDYNHPSPTVELAAAQELERLIIKPLAPLLGGKKTIYLSPDGQLHLVPFAALHDGQSFLIDRYQIVMLGSGRDLLRERKPASGVVVIADPQFAGKKGAPAVKRALLPGVVPPLPGTRKEAEALRKLIPEAKLMLGLAASEPALLATRAPGVLHVATHGVFLSDLPQAGEATSRGLKVVGDAPAESSRPSASPDGAGKADTGPKNPLLRSALVLAGAQTLPLDPKGEKPDGLATALEIAGMNLWGTELVVLSACDTGRGDIKLGQGVFGLRRALMVAGAESVVTSLWKVDDDATRDLMTRFYGALREGTGRAESLRRAALEVRKTRPHPYYWAPFAAIGHPGPVDALKGAR
jgi:CHAT domain-containing protein/tetratricopeptide (TPR) repeat protein